MQVRLDPDRPALCEEQGRQPVARCLLPRCQAILRVGAGVAIGLGNGVGSGDWLGDANGDGNGTAAAATTAGAASVTGLDGAEAGPRHNCSAATTI